jgi:hypothetical protein
LTQSSEKAAYRPVLLALVEVRHIPQSEKWYSDRLRVQRAEIKRLVF